MGITTTRLHFHFGLASVDSVQHLIVSRGSPNRIFIFGFSMLVPLASQVNFVLKIEMLCLLLCIRSGGFLYVSMLVMSTMLRIYYMITT
jgi:hypothetical protein